MAPALTCTVHPSERLTEAVVAGRAVWRCPVLGCRHRVDIPVDVLLREAGHPTLPGLEG